MRQTAPQRLPAPQPSHPAIVRELRAFQWNGRPTRRAITSVGLAKSRPIVVETFVNEFWTSKQRAANSLHEVSYRACFKPQLPRFFIDRFTEPGDVVYDPFMGRGTTVIEAALAGRTPAGCDINPLSAVLAQPRLSPPTAEDVEARLAALDSVARDCQYPGSSRSSTIRKRCAKSARCANTCSTASAAGRSTASIAGFGWSPSIVSPVTLPASFPFTRCRPIRPTSVEAQTKINARRKQVPPRRDVRALIATKTRSLLSDCDSPTRAALLALVAARPAADASGQRRRRN